MGFIKIPRIVFTSAAFFAGHGNHAINLNGAALLGADCFRIWYDIGFYLSINTSDTLGVELLHRTSQEQATEPLKPLSGIHHSVRARKSRQPSITAIFYQKNCVNPQHSSRGLQVQRTASISLLGVFLSLLEKGCHTSAKFYGQTRRCPARAVAHW